MPSRALLPVLLALLLASPAPAAEPAPKPFAAKCIRVHDGDTLTVVCAGPVQVKVRLEGIDAPEMGQPFGKAAKEALSALVFGKRITIRPTFEADPTVKPQTGEVKGDWRATIPRVPAACG